MYCLLTEAVLLLGVNADGLVWLLWCCSVAPVGLLFWLLQSRRSWGCSLDLLGLLQCCSCSPHDWLLGISVWLLQGYGLAPKEMQSCSCGVSVLLLKKCSLAPAWIAVLLLQVCRVAPAGSRDTFLCSQSMQLSLRKPSQPSYTWIKIYVWDSS